MRTKTRLAWGRVAGAMGMAVCLSVCGAAMPALAQGDAPKSPSQGDKQDFSKMEKKDMVIFKTGNKVEGVILSEDATSIKMLVIVGGLRSVTTYGKSEILEIKRNEFKPGDAKTDAKADESKESKETPVASTSGPTDYAQPVDRDGKVIPPGTTKVYVVSFEKEFGRDVSKTPVRGIMDDMARAHPDVIVFRFDEEFAYHGEEIGPDFVHVGKESLFTLAVVKTQEIDTLITPRLRDDPAFAHKPKVVAWVKKAMGPGAMLPLVFHDIYFTNDGLQGAVGGLDFLFEGVGDEVVRQKQRSLRLAWIKGLAEEGGHDSRIVQAMCWADFILSYRIVGGQVEFAETMPPTPEWFLLKDDGGINEARRDTMQDVVRMKGNDFLTLDAKKAYDIGLSKGMADSVDELMDKMGITRNYAQMKNKSGQILKDWSKNVSKTEKEVERLIKAFRGVEVKAPGQYEQRTAARGERIRYLQQIKSIMGQYAEAINPERVGDPERVIDQIDVIIDRIKTEQQLDRRP